MPCEHENAAIRAAHCPGRLERHVAGRSHGRMLTDAEAMGDLPKQQAAACRHGRLRKPPTPADRQDLPNLRTGLRSRCTSSQWCGRLTTSRRSRPSSPGNRELMLQPGSGSSSNACRSCEACNLASTELEAWCPGTATRPPAALADVEEGELAEPGTAGRPLARSARGEAPAQRKA
jgi:hypothetical protein